MVSLSLELKNNSKDVQKIKRLYSDVVRLSSRILITIFTLRDMEKTLNRPFVFKGIAYDEFMGKEIRVLRFKIIKTYPELDDRDPDLRLFLKSNGDVADVKISKKAEWEMPKDYISESSDESDHDDFTQINHNTQLQQIKNAPFSRSMKN
jgi:hypothetical protein